MSPRNGGCPYKKQKRRNTEAHGRKGHTKMEGEIETMQQEAEEHQGLPTTSTG